MKNSNLTEDKAEETPNGGVLVGKRKGQTIIHNKGSLSGYLVGKTHAEGGIQAVNKSTGQPLEMQGGEVVITAPAVSDNTKREFEGKMMTNREILSAINEKGGGVAFADGGDIPKDIKRTGASYKYGGKTMTDHEICKYIIGGHLAEGYSLREIANIHQVPLSELKEQVRMGMKAESEHTPSKREQMKIVKDHLFENPKYYSLLEKAGLEDGGYFNKDEKYEIGGIFHGSPYSFDKFTTERMGSGSGKQIDGWGIYLTDSKDSSKIYGRNIYETTLFKGKDLNEYTFIDLAKPVKKDIVSKIVKAVYENYNKDFDINKFNLYYDYAKDKSLPKVDFNDYELIEFDYAGFLFYKTLSRILGGDKKASLFLLDNGIDGLKRNISKTRTDYIIFDADDITIDKKESFSNGGSVLENNFPDEVIGNDNIVFVKEWEINQNGKNIAHYNIYWKGYDIDFGGHTFESIKSLKKFKENYILSNNLYDKLKYQPEKQIPNKSKYNYGGQTESLVRDAKSGNTPARDLNNYNDVIDLQADGMVGADTGLYARGGMVVTSVKEIPNFEQRLNERRISYRGLGSGKLADDFYELAGESGTRIKVDGKEYYITDKEFDTFSRDENGRFRVRFEAPERKYDGGDIKPYDANMEGDSAYLVKEKIVSQEDINETIETLEILYESATTKEKQDIKEAIEVLKML
jgi:hypothetical protein